MPVGRLYQINTGSPRTHLQETAPAPSETRDQNMFADDDRPKPKKLHELGCDLTFLSADEIEERIALLHEEIERLEADKASKTSSRSAAESFFKSK